MDPNRLKEAYQQLESLEDRLAYKVRPRSGMSTTSLDQIDQRQKDLANFTLELKDIMKEFMLAFAKQGTGPR